MITLLGIGVILLLALTLSSFVPRSPTIEAQAPSLQGQNEPGVTIQFNTNNSKEEYGNSLYAKFTFTNFQDITCDKNDGGTHNTAFDDPCYFQSEVHRRPPETGRVSQCEGLGMGGPRSFSKGTGARRVIDYSQNPTASTCPVGLYMLKVKLKESDKTVVATASANFEIIPAQPTNTPAPTSTSTYTPRPTATSTNTTTSTATPTNTATPTPTPTVDDSIQNSPPEEDPTATPTATPTPTEMPPPNARIEELPSTFNQGQQTSFRIVFENLDESDQYGYRADVTRMDDHSAADSCEGTGLGGSGQYTAHLSGMVKNQVTVSGQIDTSCPASKYSVGVTLMASSGYEHSTSQEFQVVEVEIPTATATPTETPTAAPAGTATPTATPMPPPSVRIDGLPPAFDQGRQTPFNLIFEGIDDMDQYSYRADVTGSDSSNADSCEGTGLGGASRYTAQLNGAVNSRLTIPAAIDANCPSGAHTLTVTLLADGGYSYTATQAFQVNGLSLAPIRTATPTATATNPPRQQQPPQQQPTSTNTPAPTATNTVAPTHTPTKIVSYSPLPLQKQPAATATATSTPKPAATPSPTLTPTVTPTDDLSDDFPDSIVSVDDGEETDSGADSGTASTAQQTTSADDASDSAWSGHYAAGRSVWDCQNLGAVVDSLAAFRSTMTAGSYPQAETQPEIMNARLGPGLAYDVIITLPQGTRASITGIDPRNGWYQLELSNLDIPVWVHQGLATAQGSLDNVRQVSAAELAQLPVSGAPGSRPTGITRSEVMNVRLGPGFDYEVLTTLPHGTQVEVIGISPGREWLQVELDGIRSLGWLYRDLVQVDCPLVNVRRITEREAALAPAALTQPYALHAFSGPGLAYDRVTVLPRGTWAQIIAIGDCPPNVWYQIIVPGLDEPVWVVRDFVKVAIGSLAGLPRYGVNDFTPPAADRRPIAVTQPDTLNLRTGPGLEYDIVAEAPQGTQARIYGVDPSESWLLVEVDGHSTFAWIYRHMAQVNGSLVGVRLVTAAEITAQPAVLIQPHAVFGRSGPGTEYAAVTILPKGAWARVVGIGPRSEWLLIQVAGMDEPVWVLCDLMKIIGSLTGLPRFSP